MMADELCALFEAFDLRETKEHEKLKVELQSALEKYRGSLPAIADVMDTGDEQVGRHSGLCFLYMEWPVMANCLARQCLVSNMRSGGISVTNLPPYQADVALSEVSNALRSLGEGSIINYGDPYRNSYFAAFVPTNRFKRFVKINLATVNGGSVEYDALVSMPLRTRNAYAARARRERNEAYQCILGMLELPPWAKKYLQQNITSIQRQENRWRLSSQVPCSERALFWLWLAVMQAAVVVPDIVSGFLGAAVAVLRSGPITLQTQLMVLAIFDYPWADERLARFLACEIFMGGLPVVLFGTLAIALPSHKGTAFHSAKDVAWKATVCILWQMLMQNRKNIQDLFNYAYFRKMKFFTTQHSDFDFQYKKLKTSSTIIYSWFDTFHVSNRLQAQIGYHKQDHEDILKALRWVSDITDDEKGNPRGSKAGILAAILAMGALICLSTFPVDPYSGLIVMANMVPLAVRAAVDVMDKSQSSHDLLRLFTATAGISFPSTLFMVANMVYWLLKGKALFMDLSSVRFWLSFVLIFFMSLFPKLRGKIFIYFGSRCLDGDLAP